MIAHDRVRQLVLAGLVLVCASPHWATAQPANALRTADPPRTTALRISGESPVLDGRLDDSIWSQTVAVDRFTQDYPEDGAPSTERTEIRVAYDAKALYVAARLFDRDPSAVIGRLGRRDDETSSDRFIVSIDSYHDHRTAFRFAVNPAGVRRDYIASNDSDSEDESWDPVWEVEARVDSLGWVAELRIPFSQLRFSSADEQTWGINFTRLIFRKNEWAAWSWWSNEEQGFASHFGHLDGLRGLKAPRRLEILPYTVSKSDHIEGADANNPFHDGSRQTISGGLDVNFGVTSDLTLNASINPDFGQVEADPAQVNLTAFETFFEERRPFFVEGSNLFQFGAGSGGFSFGAPQLFYSRRIGRSPARRVFEPGGYADNPINTSILAATKLSGQTGGWSIGIVDALTSREYAEVEQADGVRREDPVEPRANYGAVTLRRDFRGGSSSIGLMGTSVNRDLNDSVFDRLTSSAYTGGIEFFHRFNENRYVVNGTFSASRVAGAPAAITRIQRSSARYYQRPDQDYVELDSAATSLTGYAASLQFDKVSGNWLFGTDFYAYSPGFEANDAGFLTTVDEIFHGVRFNRRWLEPGDLFRRFTLNANIVQTWNYAGVLMTRGYTVGANAQFLNYWGARLNFSYRPTAQSQQGTRGGPLIKRPGNWSLNGVLISDGRKRLSSHAWTNYARNEFGGWGVFSGGGVSWRASDGMTINVFPGFNRSHTIGQFVTSRADPTATATFGSRYLHAELRQNSFNLTFRMDLALSTEMSIQWYARPFIATGDYKGFKELNTPRTYDFLYYGETGSSTLALQDGVYFADPDGPGEAPEISFSDPDFRLRSIQSNLVFRWEYVPGSTLFLVWNHGRSGFASDPTFNIIDEFGGIWEEDMQNTVLLKLNYWFSR